MRDGHVESDGGRGEASIAESLYLKAVAGGSAVDIDRLCDENPDAAEGLRRMHEQVLHALKEVEDETSPWEVVEPPTRELTAGADPEAVTVAAGQPAPGEEGPGVLARLIARRNPAERYRIVDKIGSGGMGVIYRVWDKDLRRHSALKIIRPDKAQRGRADTYSVRLLDQFLEEAQVTGQLEHPGIVPVHELGLTADGRIQFTMRLVKGEDLAKIFRKVRTGAEGWNQTRAVGILQRVCETMAFAHSKNVIHRDLKPSNIMVGRFGETYVMDWGLARVLGRRDHRNLEIAPGEDSEEIEGPVMTYDGHVVGTPAYMSPEQAGGRVEEMGPRADVYAMGAILYELLAGRPPYVDEIKHPPPARRILFSIQRGPPTRIDKFSRDAPPELEAICTKAMARKTGDRYATMEELAVDLRAYLESRVVRAYQTGPIAELKKWVMRNRGFAAALGLLLVVFIGAGFAVAGVESRRATEAVRHLDEQRAAVLVARADKLGPIDPDSVPGMDHWLEQARRLVGKMDDYRRELEALESEAESIAPGAPSIGVVELEEDADYLKGFIGQLQGILGPEAEKPLGDWDRRIVLAQIENYQEQEHRMRDELRRRQWLERVVAFRSPSLSQRHGSLAVLLANLEVLRDPPVSLIDRVRAQRDLAADLPRRTIDEASAEWAIAIDSIADPSECPAYGGLRIRPQLGVIPLRQNETTGLWEFWHVLSGERPAFDSRGGLLIAPETGIVLVLVPGGLFTMGAQADSLLEPNYDPMAKKAEGPLLDVVLAPYFISKYEMTQAQWYRATGSIPSENFAAHDARDTARTMHLNPVEHVSWTESREVMSRWLLTIPTEAQWERAARGGSSGPYWTDTSQVFWHVNAYDRSAWKMSTSERGNTVESNAPTYRDGFPHHAPVDMFSPNPFGLYHVLGNVREWTLDWYCENYGERVRTVVDGSCEVRPVVNHPYKTFRGGGFEDSLEYLRVTQRFKSTPYTRDEDIGIRPARRLDVAPGR